MQLRKGADNRSSLTILRAWWRNTWQIQAHNAKQAFILAWNFKSDPPRRK